jgi:hypothetical protein
VSDSSVFGVRDGRKRYAKMAPTMATIPTVVQAA